jgi:hypothetical protein
MLDNTPASRLSRNPVPRELRALALELLLRVRARCRYRARTLSVNPDKGFDPRRDGFLNTVLLLNGSKPLLDTGSPSGYATVFAVQTVV